MTTSFRTIARGFARTRAANGDGVVEFPRAASIATILLVLVLVALVVVALDALDAAVDPWRQPGHTWERGMLAGDTIRFLDSGRFVHATWCDVCGDMPESVGTWEERGDTILLNAQVATLGFLRSRALRRVRTGDCVFLVENISEREPASIDSMAFALKRSPCEGQRWRVDCAQPGSECSSVIVEFLRARSS